MLCLVCALTCEGAPLINHFKLKKISQSPFPLFEGVGICLIVSGIGERAALAATCYLGGKYEHTPLAFLNIGIAAHPAFAVGTCALIGKVKGESSPFYPVKTFPSSLPLGELVTVDVPDLTYQGSDFIDMEGAGFVLGASRFTSFELIHLIKIVSDNAQNPAEKIDPPFAGSLIEKNLKGILEVISHLKALTEQEEELHAPPIGFSEICDKVRLSFSQKNHLFSLLQAREQLPLPKFNPSWYAKLPPKLLIAELEEEIDGVAPVIGGADAH